MANKHSKKRTTPAAAPADTASAGQGPSIAPNAILPSLAAVDPRWVLGAILVVGAVLRLLYLISIQANPDYNLPTSDAAYKHFWAQAILTGNPAPPPGMPDPELATSPYVRPPAYPFFMALVYLLTGNSFTALRVIQMAFGLASCWLLFRLGRRIFTDGVALTASFLMSTYWIFVFFEGELNSPALIVFLVLCILNLALDWAAAPARKSLVWLGLLFGILVLDRPETLLFLPVLLAWGYFAANPLLSIRQRIAQLVLIPAMVALCIAPVTLRNYLRSGEPVLICTIGGLNFYAGNNPDATGYFPNLDYAKMFGVAQGLSHHNFPQLVQGLERKTGAKDLTQSDLQDYFVSEALRFIRENPGQALKLAFKKAAYFWGPHEISSDKVFELEKTNSDILRYLPPFAVFMPLAVLGLFLLVLGRFQPQFRLGVQQGAWPALALIGAFVFVVFFNHIIFFVVARFRIPVIPFVLLFAAFALAHGARLLLRRDSAYIGLWSGMLIVSAIIFSVPWVPYTADAVMYHYQRALIYGHTGNTSLAINELKLAVNEGGDRSADVCSELGFGLSLQGEVDNALFWYNKAIELDPNHVLSLQRKGEALLSRNEADGAAEAFRRAVKADFTNLAARLGLVRSLVRLGGFDEAQAIADETANLELGPFEGEIMRGELAAYQGRHEEAIRHYQQAADMRPNDAEIHNLLGMQHAALTQYDDAIAAYNHAIELRPGFAVAYTNLGNLYAHRGEYDNAIVQYTEALTANPYEPGAEYGWGFVNAQRGETNAAIQRFKNAVNKYPNYMEAHNYLGFLLLQTGNLSEARFHLERATRLNPRFVPAHNNLGDVYLKEGKLAEAEAQYKAVLELQPGESYATAQLTAVAQERIRQQVKAAPEQKVLVFPGS